VRLARRLLDFRHGEVGGALGRDVGDREPLRHRRALATAPVRLTPLGEERRPQPDDGDEQADDGPERHTDHL